jgi:hypothetical protein
MIRAPVIDGHIDLPIFVREAYGNDINKFDMNARLVRFRLADSLCFLS